MLCKMQNGANIYMHRQKDEKLFEKKLKSFTSLGIEPVTSDPKVYYYVKPAATGKLFGTVLHPSRNSAQR